MHSFPPLVLGWWPVFFDSFCGTPQSWERWICELKAGVILSLSHALCFSENWIAWPNVILNTCETHNTKRRKARKSLPLEKLFTTDSQPNSFVIAGNYFCILRYIFKTAIFSFSVLFSGIFLIYIDLLKHQNLCIWKHHGISSYKLIKIMEISFIEREVILLMTKPFLKQKSRDTTNTDRRCCVAHTPLGMVHKTLQV